MTTATARLTPKQKELVELILSRSEWPKYFDRPKEKYGRSVNRLTKRGLIRRYEGEMIVVYFLSEFCPR